MTAKPGKLIIRNDPAGSSLIDLIAQGIMPSSIPSGQNYAVVEGGEVCEVIIDPEDGKPLAWWCHCGSGDRNSGFGDTLEEARAERYRKASIAMGLEP